MNTAWIFSIYSYVIVGFKEQGCKASSKAFPIRVPGQVQCQRDPPKIFTREGRLLTQHCFGWIWRCWWVCSENVWFWLFVVEEVVKWLNHFCFLGVYITAMSSICLDGVVADVNGSEPGWSSISQRQRPGYGLYSQCIWIRRGTIPPNVNRRVVVWQASHRQGKIIRNMRSSNSTCFRGIAAFIECKCNWLFQTGSGLVIHSKPPIDHWRLCCSRHISVHCGGSLTGAPGHLASLAVLAGCGSDVQSRHQVLWLLWGQLGGNSKPYTIEIEHEYETMW